MKARIDYQVIQQDGKPVFAVVPYNDFVRLLKSGKPAIPHEVVRANLVDGVSLVRAWREYLGLTQAEVAKRAGFTQAALSQLEHPEAKPRKTTLQKLALALGIKVEQLRG